MHLHLSRNSTIFGMLFCFAVSAPIVKADTPPKQVNQHNAEPKSQGQRSAPQRFAVAATETAFIENRGQFDPRVRFQVRGHGSTLWLTDDGVVFDVVRYRAPKQTSSSDTGSLLPELFSAGRNKPPNQDWNGQRLVFTEYFRGSAGSSKLEASAMRPETYNYFIGNDPSKWRTRVRAFSEVTYREVWPGIDLRIAARGQDIEQEYVIHPGADPRQISMGSGVSKGCRWRKTALL